MKTITLTDMEIAFLSSRFNEELTKFEMEISNIKNILNKLKVPSIQAKTEITEQIPKVLKRRGRPPKVKSVEPKEPKKRGRKPKVILPIIEKLVTSTKPEQKDEPKPSKINKRGPKGKEKQVILKEKKKRGRPPRKTVVPTTELGLVISALQAKKEEKNTEQKQKITSKTKGKVVKKPAPKLKVELKPVVEVESVPITNEITEIPKKEIWKTAKKKTTKRRRPKGMVTLARLGKSFHKKESVIEPELESESKSIPLGEPVIPPTEETKE